MTVVEIKLPFSMGYLYRVYVDGKKYDRFSSDTSLSKEEMQSVAAGYKEALDNYRPSC